MSRSDKRKVLRGFRAAKNSDSATPQAAPASEQQSPGHFYRQLLEAAAPGSAAHASQPSQDVDTATAAAESASHTAAAAQDDAAAQPSGDTAGAPCRTDPRQPDGNAAELDAAPGLGSEQQRQWQPTEILPAVSRDDLQKQRDSTVAVAGPTPYGIPADNVGFKMLQKAGWQLGTGLGLEGQGLRVPLEESQQKGRRGLGADATATAAAAAASRQPGQQQTKQQQQQAKKAKSARIPLPEDKESLDTKVKRHRQVLQAEADAAAGKAIHRYMYMAFNDTAGEVTADSNPLLRRSRLTAYNPLL